MASTQKIIKITIDGTVADKKLRQLERGLSSIDRSTKRLSGTFGRLDGAIAGFLTVRSISILTDYSDQLKLLGARINVFKKEGEEAADIQSRLLDITKSNGLTINASVEAYSKFSNGLKNSNLSSQQILDTIEATTSAFRIFGVAGAQAESAVLQLSQGLQKGNLDGEEFKSISENASILLDIFAKEAGVARGELKDFASQGKLTSNIIVNGLLRNLEDLNNQAKDIPLTFGQIKNNLSISFGEEVSRFENATGTFNKLGKSAEYVAENLDLVGIAVAGIAGTQIPRLVLAIKSLTITGSFNPLIAGLGLLSAGITAIVLNMDKVKKYFDYFWSYIKKGFSIAWLNIEKGYLRFITGLRSALNDGLSAISKFLPGKIEITGKENHKNDLDRIKQIQNELDILYQKKILVHDNSIESKAVLPGKSVSSIPKREEPSREANRLLELGKAQKKLNDEFQGGKLSVDEFNLSLDELKIKYRDVDYESEQVFAGLSSGLNKYASEATNLASNIANAVSSTFSGLEDQLVSFITKGKFEFKQFTQSILEDLTRIIIRTQITGALAQGITGALGGSSGATVASANGNVFSGGNVQKFASGGIVNRATSFPMVGGKTGIMGEAGPEAILPLTRKNGKLGVSGGGSNVYVNIVNQGSGEVETSERKNGDDKIIDVIIKNSVKQGFNEGSFDKEMKTSFGLNRRGGI